MEESILQTRRQWLQLRRRRLRILLFLKLTLAVRIYFLGEVNGRHLLQYWVELPFLNNVHRLFH
jgi:hypothetical protein